MYICMNECHTIFVDVVEVRYESKFHFRAVLQK